MKRIKLLILQGELAHYRIGLFEQLANHYHVFVVHGGADTFKSSMFHEVQLKARTIGPFNVIEGYFSAVRNINPDVIIVPDHLRWIQFVLTRFLIYRKKYIWWGVEENKYKTITEAKIFFINKLFDPVIFYTKERAETFRNMGLNNDLINFTNNTVYGFDRICLGELTYDGRNSFINVGSLVERKQNDITLKAFSKLRRKPEHRDIRLILIGDGPDLKRLQEMAENLFLTGAIDFIPFTSSPIILSGYYRKAIASVSFGQAGLAVLQSFANGVPFITKKGTITGGEASNIIHGHTGVFCEDSVDSLAAVLNDILSDRSRAQQMGRQAREHFEIYCSPQSMCNSFQRIINDILSK